MHNDTGNYHSGQVISNNVYIIYIYMVCVVYIYIYASMLSMYTSVRKYIYAYYICIYTWDRIQKTMMYEALPGTKTVAWIELFGMFNRLIL